MKSGVVLVLSVFMAVACASAQTSTDAANFKLALPTHPGQLQWSADGFKVIQSSAKPNGREIGIRGQDQTGLTFLAFLFLFPERAPLTSTKCRDGVLSPEQKSNPTLKILSTSEAERADNNPVAIVNYTSRDRDGKLWYAMRGFIASSDICGDIEFYGNSPIDATSPRMKKILESYRLDPNYIPQFSDVFLYAEVLYRARMYKASAPILEQALGEIADDKNQETTRRAITDQAGMAYGISGDVPKARAIFEAAIARDPDYPLYYYNLACADAQEKKLTDARIHLQQAFARKANIIPGETMPDPTKDDSFLPYKHNKDFWAFIETLH
ncbi:MAG TPA: tetratricopeptide repeat protein [Candidatus Acidoferrales bacterium]|nr:tetratricopeptide repeat protein [Candidatus Acidoferrales bacterium]